MFMSKLKRFAVFLGILVVCWVPALAQNDYLCLYSWNQAENNSWGINQIRKMTFTSTELVVSLMDNSSTYSFSYENFRKLTFEEQPLYNDVETLNLKSLIVFYDSDRNLLLIKGVKGYGLVQIFNSVGLQIITYNTNYEDYNEYNLSSLSKGVYIIKVTDKMQSEIYKIQIK